MPRRATPLTEDEITNAASGRYGDGAGLYLLVRSDVARSWLFRYVRDGKMREMGLGSAVGRTAISLANARAKARVYYDAVRDGRDPLAEQAAAKAEKRSKSFRYAAEQLIAAREKGWTHQKHWQQWTNTLATYAYPLFGDKSVSDISVLDVLAALKPIWTGKSETATRVRGRIEAVLDYAKEQGWRVGENAARWRGGLDKFLPAPERARRGAGIETKSTNVMTLVEKETALYRHFDADQRLLYVGIALDPLVRSETHRDNSPWFREIASISIEWFENRTRAVWAEKAAAEAERPLYNSRHNAPTAEQRAA